MKKFISTFMALILGLMLVFTVACSDSKVDYLVTVKDVADTPSQGITVYISEGENVLSSAETDESGQVLFSLKAGEYTVTVEEDDLPSGYRAGSYKTDLLGTPITIIISSSIIPGEAPNSKIYAEGDVMYDFTYETVEYDENGNLVKNTRTLAQSFEEGKEMVLINFFYTTCSPCAIEFPLIETAYNEYDLVVDVISICDYALDSEETIAAYKEAMGLSFYFSYDDNGSVIGKHFDIEGYPTNIIVDRYGVVCMIETGGITDVNTFRNWFEKYTGDDYIQDVGNDFVLDKPDIENPDVNSIANAINDSSIDGKIEYFWEEDDEYSWPWIVDDDGKTIRTSNAHKIGSYSSIYANITLEEGEVLAFDYKTSTEAGSDVFYVIVDNEIIYQYSGSSQEDFATSYVFVGDGNSHILALAYVKDTGSDVGDDTVYLKNMRVTDEAELVDEGVGLNILRQAATNYNELLHIYTDYVDVVYNSNDGYYHVGDVNGPYLLANLIDNTQWGEGLYNESIGALSLYNVGTITESSPEFVLVGENIGTSENPVYKNYELIEKYSWYGRYSQLGNSSFALTPVTPELHDLLVEVVSLLGDEEVDDEKEWLELCRYYEQYGNTEEITDPLVGLTIETAASGHMGKNNVYTFPKSPRGMVFSFVPTQTGAYKIYADEVNVITTGSVGSGTYTWLFGSDYGDIFEPSVIAESEDGSIICELEAGETYYISCALSDPNLVGTCILNIEYYDQDFVIRAVASDTYTFEEGSMEIYLQTYVDVRLMDGYYYAFDKVTGENYGRIFVDFNSATSFSSAPLKSWIEMVYKDENGNVTETRHMFDFSENGYYATNNKEFYESCVPQEYRKDYTDIMKNYAANVNAYGYALADEQLVDILKILMALEDRLTDNAWTQLCYYIEELTVIAPQG